MADVVGLDGEEDIEILNNDEQIEITILKEWENEDTSARIYSIIELILN